MVFIPSLRLQALHLTFWCQFKTVPVRPKVGLSSGKVIVVFQRGRVLFGERDYVLMTLLFVFWHAWEYFSCTGSPLLEQPHWLHWFDFFPLCVFKCLLKLPAFSPVLLFSPVQWSGEDYRCTGRPRLSCSPVPLFSYSPVLLFFFSPVLLFSCFLVLLFSPVGRPGEDCRCTGRPRLLYQPVPNSASLPYSPATHFKRHVCKCTLEKIQAQTIDHFRHERWLGIWKHSATTAIPAGPQLSLPSLLSCYTSNFKRHTCKCTLEKSQTDAINVSMQECWRDIWKHPVSLLFHSPNPSFPSLLSCYTSNLKRHMKVHTWERSNKCNQCDYNYLQIFLTLSLGLV